MMAVRRNAALGTLPVPAPPALPNPLISVSLVFPGSTSSLTPVLLQEYEERAGAGLLPPWMRRAAIPCSFLCCCAAGSHPLTEAAALMNICPNHYAF